MTKQEYEQMIILSLKLRIAESSLAESLKALKEANQHIRDLIIKECQ